MTQSTYPQPGAQQSYGQPYPPPAFGEPTPPFGYQQPPKRKTGLVVGAVVVAVVIAGGLVVGAILLFGSKTLDTGAAEAQVGRIAQEQLGVQLADLHCPADIEVEKGGTFSCTATVEDQAVSFTVTQQDEEGNVQIESDNTYFAVADIEAEVASQVQDQTGIAVEGTCDAGGRTVLVDAAGTQVGCTVTNTEDSSDTLAVTARINDDGTVSVEG